MMTRSRRVAFGLTLDLLLWYAAPVAFLTLYLSTYSAPRSAVLPHLLLLALPFTALILVRFALLRLFGRSILQRATSSLIVFSALTLILLYYTCALIGLHFWGGVVAWNVIPTYFAQAPELLDAIGASLWIVIAALALAGALLFALCWSYLARFDWTPEVGGSNIFIATCVVAGLAIVGAEIYRFANAPSTTEFEPISLTLFPGAGGVRDMEGHAINAQAARAADAAEDQARAAYMPAIPGARKNLIVFVVDALRPDHMSLFGYARETTPNLDRLDRLGEMRKIIAHASCGDTICGLLSMWDSKFPKQFSFRPFGLHEVLRRNGYRVHAILSGDHSAFYNMKSYYGTVDTYFDGTQARGRFINDDELVVDRLAAMPDFAGTPTMFQFHLMSAHVLRKRDDSGRYQPAKRYIGGGSDTDAPSTPVQSAVNFYDNGVANADAFIGRLLDSLDRKGYLHNALVVITADHGESLGEHGMLSHANSVHEELLRIPVVLISCGDESRAAIDQSPLPLQVDIAPTLLQELGLPQPRTWVGRPLQNTAREPFAYFEERSYAGVIDMRDSKQPWKYWIDRVSGGEHAIDLRADPGETANLIGRVPDSLRQELRFRAVLGTPPGPFGTLALNNDARVTGRRDR
jgi:glucan phosphoethanolaminetransferase (alkaline phosphatase superfamily)